MKGIIRLGDKTSHGGKVTSASTPFTVDGRPVARVGDPCDCPLPGHSDCRIETGDPNFLIDGIPAAFDGDKTSCGAILHADPEADKWLRKARFDGRTEGVPVGQDKFDVLGYHAYLSPETAAKGLMRLSLLKGDEPDLPNSDYPDLSQLEIFK